MPNNPTPIVIDCERMKYPHTGLYHYCLQLGNALMKERDVQQEQLYFYLPQKEQGVFGEGVQYLPQDSLHKFYIPSLKGKKIWHSTYQGTMYYPRRRNMKVVLTIHDINFMYDHHKPAAKKEKYLKQLQQKIERADHVVAISRYVLDDVRQYINLDNKPATVIYNGCNITGSLANIQPPAQAPQQPFLYTIGTITHKKNFHVLPALLAKNDYMLVISGIVQSEAYKQEIIAEAKKWGVEDRVIFTGSISENDKYWYYQHCTAFVFPSLAEGFGLPVVEAMHFGRPVILSTLTSLPEVGGEVAYYFENFDAASMQEVLANSLAHYDSTPGKGDSIRQRAALFNWEDTARAYLDIYRSLY